MAANPNDMPRQFPGVSSEMNQYLDPKYWDAAAQRVTGSPPQPAEVPDPFGCTPSDYQRTRQQFPYETDQSWLNHYTREGKRIKDQQEKRNWHP